MESARWQRIRVLFEGAVEQPVDRQRQFVETACGEDRALRDSVLAMLAADREGTHFLDSPLESQESWLDAEERWTGRRIGPYRIEREIGTGGMGAVFLAVRDDDEFEQQVAVKLLKQGLPTAEAVRRFRGERQILAWLDHPNIAKLLDGGTTDDRLPYLVMEYVEGDPIIQYCDRRVLSMDRRLELFLHVCSAVAYAHKRLIVHRDIKPGNILVTEEGAPKLLDFGIAKLLAPGIGEDGLAMTQTVGRPMTPRYASPEQALGKPITTASDVYSLGVLLYELLAGRMPYELDTTPAGGLERVIAEEEPRPPSAAWSGKRTTSAGSTAPEGALDEVSAARSTTPARLRRSLRGDLDNIILKALRKEPERRYGSVEAYVDDIGRYLNGHPVAARKPTLTYRAGKFLRRRRWAVAAVALIAGAVAVGGAATVWQMTTAQAERARAERRFDDVRQLANVVIFDLHDAIRDLPGSTPVRALLLDHAIDYLDSLAREAGGDRELLFELAEGFRRIGEVRGAVYEDNIGDIEGAVASYKRALDVYRKLLDLAPDLPAARFGLAECAVALGDLAVGGLGETARGVEYYEMAAAILQDEDRTQPTDELYAATLRRVQASLADGLYETGRFAESVEVIEALLRDRELDVTRHPDDADLVRRHAEAHHAMAYTVAELGDLDRTLEHGQRAIDIMASLGDPTPFARQYRIIFERDHAAFLLAAGRLEDGLRLAEASLPALEAMQSEDPENVQFTEHIAVATEIIGVAHWQLGNLDEALAHLNTTRDASVTYLSEIGESAEVSRFLAIVEQWLGDILAEKGRPAKAEASYRRAVALGEKLQAADAANAPARRDLATAYLKLARLLGRLGRCEAANSAQELGAALWDELWQIGVRVTPEYRGPAPLLAPLDCAAR